MSRAAASPRRASRLPVTGILVWPLDDTPHGSVWQVPVWLRLARQLSRQGAREILVAGPAPEAVLGRAPGASPLRPLAADALGAHPDDTIYLAVAANWVIDDAVLANLAARSEAAVATRGGGDGTAFAGAARLTRSHVAELLKAGAGPATISWLSALPRNEGVTRVGVETLSDYRLNLRRRIPIFTREMAGPEDLRRAMAFALDATQKGTNDLPAQYVHPPLENGLVRLLVPLGVGPNSVTAATVAVGLGAAGCFAGGWLLTGILLAMVVGVLDGVDGKIARVTVTTTRIGDYVEHISDNVYEMLWYLGLGSHLAGTSGLDFYRYAAWAMCGVYLADRAALAWWKLYRQGDFHESSAWDRQFRRICGRRNNIVYLLLVFFLLGQPHAGFLTALVWWALTLAIHVIRVGSALHLGIGREAAVQ